eukprot:g5088.t1
MRVSSTRLLRRGVSTRLLRRGVSSAHAQQRIGFFGAGDISNLHADAIAKLPGAELVGLWNRPCCSIVPDPAAKAAEYNCKLYESPEALVADPSIDAVYVLTNMESHHALATLAMRAGKHVYIEKPVGSSVEELLSLKATAAACGVHCMPGHNYIYESGVQRIRELLDAGALGRAVSLEIHYNIQHPETVCARLPGIIRQILTHHAYCSLYLLGEAPATLTALTTTINDGSVPQDNLAMVLCKQPGAQGALSLLQASFGADDHTGDPWSFHIKLLGSEGGARYSYNDYVTNAKHIVHSHTYCAYPETIRAASAFFVREVLGAGADPLSTLDDAIVCQRIIEGAEYSAAEGQHVNLEG